MSRITPTQRTLEYYRKFGLVIQKVERWQNFGKTGEANTRAKFGKALGHRVDLFGCIDLIALGALDPTGPDEIIGIQCCGATGHAEHRAKIMAEPRAKRWLECGGRLLLVSWSKRKDGTKRLHYVPRIEEIDRFDIEAAEIRITYERKEHGNSDRRGDAGGGGSGQA